MLVWIISIKLRNLKFMDRDTHFFLKVFNYVFIVPGKCPTKCEISVLCDIHAKVGIFQKVFQHELFSFNK